jgi:hypothetical protein
MMEKYKPKYKMVKSVCQSVEPSNVIGDDIELIEIPREFTDVLISKVEELKKENALLTMEYCAFALEDLSKKVGIALQQGDKESLSIFLDQIRKYSGVMKRELEGGAS